MTAAQRTASLARKAFTNVEPVKVASGVLATNPMAQAETAASTDARKPTHTVVLSRKASGSTRLRIRDHAEREERGRDEACGLSCAVTL